MGAFYSAYSPVFDSEGKVAGTIAVDFSAEWYNQQLASLTRTTIIVAVLSLLMGGGIVSAIAAKRQKQIGSIQGQLNDMATTLMHEMGNEPAEEEGGPASPIAGSTDSMDLLEEQIQSMQTELQTRIAQVHGQACKMVCDFFSHSPVYRIGGDEFAVILVDRDYQCREVLMYRLHKWSMAHIATEGAVVSGGLAEFDPNNDQSIREVFERADSINVQREDVAQEPWRSNEGRRVGAGEVNMRFGVFVNAQQEPSIEDRFVCAKIAADKVQSDPIAVCGFYELG